MIFSRAFTRDPQTEKSLQHSIKDGIAFSVMGGVSETYFSAYAIFLKATSPQIALLASLPPLLASFWQLFSVWLGQTLGARKQIIVFGALMQAVALMLIGTLPLLFPDNAFTVLLICVIAYYTGPNIGAPLWGSLMGSIIPENLRGRFFATRTRLSSMASFTALLTAGFILQLFDALSITFAGFMTIFAIGVIARGVSAWHLQQIHDPPRPPTVEGDVSNIFRPSFYRGQRRLLRFSVFFACMQFAVAISGPFVVVYLLRDLHFSYLQLTFNTAASVLVQFLVLNRWGRLADIFGNRIILRLTGFTIPVIPALWVLSSDYWYLLLVQAVSGLVWSGFSLSASNCVYDLTSDNKRAGLMALHNVVSGSAVFLGATTGGLLAVYLPREISLGDWQVTWLSVFYGVFLVSSAMRLLVALTFLPRLEEVRSVRNMTYTGLIFRVLRFSPVSGVIFDIVGRRPGSRRVNNTPPEDD